MAMLSVMLSTPSPFFEVSTTVRRSSAACLHCGCRTLSSFFSAVALMVLKLRPAFIWEPIERRVIHTLHGHVLEGMRRKAEGPQANDKPPPPYEPQDSKLYLPPLATVAMPLSIEGGR